MATVHLGRLHGPAGFARTVAIKKLHAQFARDPEFVSMFLDEARLAARIQHPNVVSVLDVVASEGELFLIMDYVHGESLFTLFKEAARTKTPIPRRIFVSIIANVLYGLDAAHDARSDTGTPLDIVHRDVSPQNVLLGIDGVARLLDFGVAKASQRVHLSTQDGKLKGKLSYMAPEQVSTGLVDRRADVYATGVMLWEGLTGRRLYGGIQDMGLLVGAILGGEIKPPSSVASTTPKALDEITMKALARSSSDRYASAREMATALERAISPATPRQIGEWVAKVAGAELRVRAETIAQIEGRAAPANRASDFQLPAVKRVDIPIDVEDSPEAKPPVATATPPKEAETAPADEISHVSASDLLPVRSPSMVAQEDGQEESSSESSVEASLEVPGVPTRRKTTGRIAVVAVAIVGVVLIGHSCTQKSEVHAAPTPSVAAIATSGAGLSIASLPVPPSASATDNSRFIATAVTATASAATDAASTTTESPHASSSPHRNTAKNKANCDPPYTIDATGVRVPKRQCL